MLDHLLWLEPDEFFQWRRRLDMERRARTLTLHRKEALVALLSCADPDGTISVTDEHVAQVAGVSVATVCRARADARRLGLLNWENRRQLVAGRWRQAANVYSLALPPKASPDCQVVARRKERKERGLTRGPTNLNDSTARQNAARQIALLTAPESKKAPPASLPGAPR